jgi:hypothetical protein
MLDTRNANSACCHNAATSGGPPLRGPKSAARGTRDLSGIMGAEVRQHATLEVAPDIFPGVQLQSIGPHPLTLSHSVYVFHEGAYEAIVERGDPVPDDGVLLPDRAVQRLQEFDDHGVFDRIGKEPEIVAEDNDTGDDRELLPSEVIPKRRRLYL